jgi:hypothetical protein
MANGALRITTPRRTFRPSETNAPGMKRENNHGLR